MPKIFNHGWTLINTDIFKGLRLKLAICVHPCLSVVE